jgi:hypothetical protein
MTIKGKAITGTFPTDEPEGNKHTISVGAGEMYYVGTLYAVSDGGASSYNSFTIEATSGRPNILDSLGYNNYNSDTSRGMSVTVDTDSTTQGTDSQNDYAGEGEEIRLSVSNNGPSGGTVGYALMARQVA